MVARISARPHRRNAGRSPREDLISALIAAEEAGDQLTADEIVATCNLLLIAGHETTVNLIANATLALLRHPRHWAAVSADPTALRRWPRRRCVTTHPCNWWGGSPAKTWSIGDVHIPKGDAMMLLLAAAQRDPSMLRAARRVRSRTVAPSATWRSALGPHFCLGAPLARLETTIALSALTARFPNARLDGEPVYKPNVTLRGMSTLPISV